MVDVDYRVMEKWGQIVRLHNVAKRLMLKSEEVDPDHEFYYPVVMQQRDAFDHVVRAHFAIVDPERFAKTDRNPEQDPIEYALTQMDKALGHVYRAFFDAADWLSVVYRERIRDIMRCYSRSVVVAVLTDYNEVVEPRIEEISLAIAQIRSRKDIGGGPEIIDGVDEYVGLIQELEDHWATIRQAVPEMDRVEFGTRQEAD